MRRIRIIQEKSRMERNRSTIVFVGGVAFALAFQAAIEHIICRIKAPIQEHKGSVLIGEAQK